MAWLGLGLGLELGLDDAGRLVHPHHVPVQHSAVERRRVLAAAQAGVRCALRCCCARRTDGGLR